MGVQTTHQDATPSNHATLMHGHLWHTCPCMKGYVGGPKHHCATSSPPGARKTAPTEVRPSSIPQHLVPPHERPQLAFPYTQGVTLQ